MSFEQYESYQESGADWLGQIPQHWSAARVKTLFEIRKRVAGKLGHDVLSVTQQGLKIRDTDSNDGQLSMDYSKYQLVEPGDFVMNHMDLLTGYVDLSRLNGVTSPDYRVFAGRRNDLSLQFFLYLFQNGYQRKIFYAFGQGASGLGRWRMPTDSFNDFILPVPPLPEQIAIAAFLDRETTKIDALVEEQQQLIELLKEKRQAVISQAVTKGLNPHAPMKYSGVGWLGEVPQAWSIRKLATITTAIGDGLHGTPQYVDVSDHHFINGNNLANGVIRITDATGCISPEEAKKYPSPLNDRTVLISINGTIGNLALYRGEKVTLGKSAAYINCTGEIAPLFLMLFLQSPLVLHHFELEMAGTTIKNLSLETLRGLRVCLPGRSEQLEIVDALESQLARFDKLLAETNRAIALLKERRSAVISAAVTGKFDVRGLIKIDAHIPAMVAA